MASDLMNTSTMLEHVVKELEEKIQQDESMLEQLNSQRNKHKGEDVANEITTLRKKSVELEEEIARQATEVHQSSRVNADFNAAIDGLNKRGSCQMSM